MKRLRIPETVLDVQRVGVVRGVENVEVAHLVFIGGANLKMTLYLISKYGKVTEFPVDCMLLYADVDSRNVTMVTCDRQLVGVGRLKFYCIHKDSARFDV